MLKTCSLPNVPSVFFFEDSTYRVSETLGTILAVTVLFANGCVVLYLAKGIFDALRALNLTKKCCKSRTKKVSRWKMASKKFISPSPSKGIFGIIRHRLFDVDGIPRLQTPTCANCQVQDKRRHYRVCGRCNALLYCSVTCQQDHWEAVHKEKCSATTTASKSLSKVFPTPSKEKEGAGTRQGAWNFTGNSSATSGKVDSRTLDKSPGKPDAHAIAPETLETAKTLKKTEKDKSRSSITF